MFKKYHLIVITFLALSPFNLISADDFRINKWEMTEFVWNFALISSCNVGVPEKPIKYFEKEPFFDINNYKNIKKGDVVWIKGRFISQFYKKVFPTVNNPFVLVICDGDASFPSDCLSKDFNIEEFVSHDKVIHIFAQNCDYMGPSKKISHLPIGLDFHTIAYKDPNGAWGEKGTPHEQEECLKKIVSESLPTPQRKLKAFVDFQVNDTMHAGYMRHLQFGEDRAAIFKRLLSTDLIDYGKWMRRSKLWKTKSEYAFSICPHGNGLDTHRMWEDLVLGCIVITKTSPLDPLFDKLPVIIIKDWSEITQENMVKWLQQYGDVSTNPFYREKLTNAYWLHKIYTKAQEYK